MVQKITIQLPTAMQAIWNRLGTDVYPQEKLDEFRQALIRSHEPEARQVGDHYNFHVVVGRKALD